MFDSPPGPPLQWTSQSRKGLQCPVAGEIPENSKKNRNISPLSRILGDGFPFQDP